MTPLDLLALEEQRLHDAVAGARGLIEEKTRELYRAGVPEKYREVHRHYVQLARGGDTEALCRATHLQWSASFEPTAFTGLGELDPAACEDLVGLLDQLCQLGQVDGELRWMLAHYTFLADWWFDPACAPALAAFCRERQVDGPARPPPDFVSVGRGLLGRYWASMRQA